jgi:hypothetical protein
MLGVQFLYTTLTRKDARQVVHAQGLPGGRMDGRQGLVGHVGLDVIPCCRQLVLLQNKSLLSHLAFVLLLIMFKRPVARTTDLLFYFATLMIPNGQATHDFFNLELRHHQYAEIIATIISYLC